MRVFRGALNLNKIARLHIDSFNPEVETIHPTVFATKANGITQLCYKNYDRYIGAAFGQNIPFCILYRDIVESRFGKYPIAEVVSNSSNALQGGIIYNATKNVLVYSTNLNPYIAIYDCKAEVPTLMYENQIGTPHYSIHNHDLIWGINQMRGFMSVTFTKDYIACLAVEKTLREARGRDEKNLPRSIYLFDYHGALIKIFDVDYPLLRIAGITKNNTLYIIGLSEEYSLFGLNLDNVFQ